MGSDARVALYASQSLAPWVSLPQTPGGATHYYSTYTTDGTLTWVSTAILGCKFLTSAKVVPCILTL